MKNLSEVRMRLGKSVLFVFAAILMAMHVSLAQPQLVKLKLDKNNLKATAGSEVKVQLIAEIESGWHINSHKPNDEFLIPTTIKSGNKSFPISKINFPKPVERELSVSDKPVSVFEEETKFEITFKIDKATKTGKYTVPIQFGYQGCNDQTCMPPETAATDVTLDVTGVDEEAQTVPSATQNISENKQEPLPAVSEQTNTVTQETKTEESKTDSETSSFENKGLLLSLLIVFFGGLALNLTPCVYPLIPITIGYFGGQSEGRTSRLFLLGILYVLGMALTYSVIGVVTSLSGAVFGTLMQNTFVIIGIAVLFVVLALSQFGVYEFKLPDSWVMKAGGAKGGAFGAFFMGLTMGIVAAPCIGPFLLGLVTYVAAKGDPFYGFIMFFVMAMGLGTPYLILALFSGKIKSLPRAGLWMEGVKHIFGFLLLGMAIYFVNPLLPKNISSYTLPVFGIIAAVFLLFIDKMANNVKAFRIFKIVFSLIVVALSVYGLIPTKHLEPEWQKFSEANYGQSLKNNERMVEDFYADWCIPC